MLFLHIVEILFLDRFHSCFSLEISQRLPFGYELIVAREFVGKVNDKEIRLHKMVYARSYYTTNEE